MNINKISIFIYQIIKMQHLKIFCLFILFFSFSKLSAQDVFIIEGDTLQLRQEVKGPMNLYWTSKDYNYRFFVQKGKNMIELRNSDQNENSIRDFREQMEKLTSEVKLSTANLSFLLYDLKHFVNTYNSKVQEDYEINASTPNIQTRIGLFFGFSNNKYTYNPANILVPIIGLEFELYDPNLARRHSAFFHLRHSFNQEEYRYSSTQLSLNYRFRFLYFSDFNLQLDAELATLYHSSDRLYITNDSGEIIEIKEEKGFSFTAPVSFSLGSEITLSEGSFLTFRYNDIVSVFLDGNGHFPIDFTIGYKYNL